MKILIFILSILPTALSAEDLMSDFANELLKTHISLDTQNVAKTLESIEKIEVSTHKLENYGKLLSLKQGFSNYEQQINAYFPLLKMPLLKRNLSKPECF